MEFGAPLGNKIDLDFEVEPNENILGFTTWKCKPIFLALKTITNFGTNSTKSYA